MRNGNLIFALTLLFCVIFVISAGVHAATKEAASAKPDEQDAAASLDYTVAKITIYLSLTDKQARQIKPIIKEDTEKRSEIINDNKGNNDTTKTALEDLNTQTDHKLSQYLTGEQMKKWDQMQKTMQDQPVMKKGGRGRRKKFGGGTF